MTRKIRHYQRPAVVDQHMSGAAFFKQNADVVESLVVSTSAAAYEECASLLDELTYDLFKTTERYHLVVDREGPLYHVEVMDIIAKLEAILKKVGT